MGKLDLLLGEVHQEIRDKKAELQAMQTQLDALQSAHADLSSEVDKAHVKLADVRGQLAQTDNDLRKRRDEADKAASNILNAAHRARAAAGKMVNEAEDQAEDIIEAAQKRVQELDAEREAAKLQLLAVTQQVNIACGELARLKKDAGDWSQS